MARYMCPGSGIMCPTPHAPACIYTRESREEFDHAGPGEKLYKQATKLMCRPAQERAADKERQWPTK